MEEHDIRKETLKKQKALNKKLGVGASKVTTSFTNEDTGVLTKTSLNPYYGKWLKPSKQDQYIQDFNTIRSTEIGKDSNPDANRLIAALKDGQANADFYNLSSLATLISDKQNPFLEMHAKQVWPSLKTVPDEHYRDVLVLQASLHRLLDNGVITSEEDLQLIYYLSRPDVDIPVYPSWDPAGVYTNGIYKSREFKNFLNASNVEKDLFNPYSVFGVASSYNTDSKNELMQMLKAKIFKRVLPGLREQTSDNVMKFITFLADRSMGRPSVSDVLEANKDTIPNVYFSKPKA